MTKDIERLVDLYKLLNSGNYVYDNTVSFIDFIRVLRLVKSSFHICEGGCKVVTYALKGTIFDTDPLCPFAK